MEGRVETLTCVAAHNFFQSLDDGEWIYLLHANLHRPGGSWLQAADDGVDVLVACAHVSFQMAVL